MSISRHLTVGELTYARSIFGQSVDYDRVFVHDEKAYFLQPDDTAITPNGEIYFPKPVYQADFSTDIGSAAWLIHELTHVWQHQHGVNVRLQGVLYRRYEYGNLTTEGKPFSSYYIEQQASIVEDYFRMTHGQGPRRGSGAKADYERTIPFLPRPGR